MKTCALRGEGRKFNQNLTTPGYVTYWVTRLLEADVPLLIGLDGMNAMKVKLDLVDIRGYRGHADQTSEIGDLLKRLLDCVKSVKSVDKTTKPVVNTVKSVDAVHSVKQNVSSGSSVNPKDSVSSVRPENSASGGSQSVREKESQKEEEEDDSDSTARIERLLRDWDLPDEDRIGYFFLGKEYEAEKERIDRERSEHVLKVVAQKEAKRRESEARLIPKKPREVSETVSAPDVKALV
ncbi:hypothetical protein ADUPG1_002260, partial [Aduncisulcus paluster]